MRKTTTKKKILKTIADNLKPVVRSIRFSNPGFAKVESNANKYAGGNVTEWIRYAAENHKPSNKELSNG